MRTKTPSPVTGAVRMCRTAFCRNTGHEFVLSMLVQTHEDGTQTRKQIALGKTYSATDAVTLEPKKDSQPGCFNVKSVQRNNSTPDVYTHVDCFFTKKMYQDFKVNRDISKKVVEDCFTSYNWKKKYSNLPCVAGSGK